ncbi:outer membrane beta-barrel protein [Roseivirga sp.]|uniref:outer membrane beta-barrel protein n=1 Tax=Roseivirga sp. TaxID=1964215 RepID=UPI003B517EA8
MRYLLFLLLFISSLQLGFGQAFSVKGEVRDSTSKTPLPYANVVLQSTADSAIYSAVTDTLGIFQINQVTQGQYKLNISFIGFEAYTDTLDIKGNIDLKQLFLRESLTTLDDLTIEGEAVDMIIKEDTIEYNAAAYPIPEGSELEELLKKMPGVEVVDGSITVNGKKIEKMIVDGKPFFNLPIQTLLKELPADFVKKIQVIDEKSEDAQFTGHDDGERTPVINVVSKPEKKKGYFGSIRATMSPPNRYNTSASTSFLSGKHRYSINGDWNNMSSSSGPAIPIELSASEAGRMMALQASDAGTIGSHQGLGGSYSIEVNDKLNISSSFRWSNDNSFAQSDISREYIQSSDQGRIYNEQSERERDNTNIYGSVNVRYNPSDKDQYTFSQSLSSASMFTSNWRNGETLLGGELLNSSSNRTYMENERRSSDTRLGWRHKFAKEGRTLSLSFSNSYNRAEGTDTVKSVNLFTGGTIEEQVFDQLSNPDDIGINRNFSLALTEKTGENSSLSLSYTNELEESRTEQLLYDFNEQSQQYTDLDPLRSSQYVLKNKDNSIRMNYSFKIKGINIAPRLTLKSTRIQNDQEFPRVSDTDNTFTGINPGLSFYRYSDKGSQLQLSISRSMTVPRAEQLQDVLDNSNPLFLRQGNPDLSSGFRNSVSLFFYKTYNEEKSRRINIQAMASSSENATTNYTIVGDGTNGPDGIDLPVGVRYSRPVNISGAKNFNINVSLSSKVLKDKLNVSYGATVDYSFYPQYLNEQIQSSENLTYGLGIGFRSDFSEKLNLNLNLLPRYSIIQNSSPEEEGSEYFAWTGSMGGKWVIAEDFYITTNMAYTYNGGVSSLGSFDRFIMSASVGKKILKKKLDLNIHANDILRQASDQNRSLNAEYIENSSTTLLRQVVRITVSYRINKFGK